MPDAAVARLLPTVRTIAHEAGQVILRFYNDGIDVATKVDGSPVTQADHAAEAVIVPALHHLLPESRLSRKRRWPPATSRTSPAAGSGWSIRSTAPRSSSPAMASSP